MAVCGVKVIPLGTQTPSLSTYVLSCLEVLDKYKDLNYQLTPNETVIEGNLDRIFAAVKEMHEAPFKAGVLRVTTTLVIDDRRDKPLTMQGKIEAVQARRSAEAEKRKAKSNI